MKTTLIFSWVILAFAVSTPPMEASGENGVATTLTSATIATVGEGHQFEIKLGAEGSFSGISAIYKGQRVPVAKAEIPPVEKADLRQAQVKVRTGSPYPHESVILVIPFQQEFRKDPDGPANADEVRVSNVVRIMFHKGELRWWEMAVSLGEKSNSWALAEKENGDPVQSRGKVTELTNPYWTQNATRYSTRWDKIP